VNLQSILGSVADDARFEGQGQEKSIVIAHADECWLKGDPTLLRSCIENVVRNAVLYTKPRSDVVIALKLVRAGESNSARVSVADHGGGVPPEALPRLFEPFYRAPESRDRKSGGSGLGLSIAQRIAILHGGNIQAHNRESGGLEIEIWFPAKGPLGGVG
jgi:two-component system sensor histidine kinase CpxA